MFGVVPLISRRGSNVEGLNYTLKRAFDVAAGIAHSDCRRRRSWLLAALAILIFDGGPILFRQTRIGMRGRPFEMLKLRTMRSAADDSSIANTSSTGFARATARSAERDGRQARLQARQRLARHRASAAAPPLQPRRAAANHQRGARRHEPHRPASRAALRARALRTWHRRRLQAAPGITGLWQVSGRNQLSFDEMVELDVQYLEDWSLTGDLRILARTVPAMLRGSGV